MIEKENILKVILGELRDTSPEEALITLKESKPAYDMLRLACKQLGTSEIDYIKRIQSILKNQDEFDEILSNLSDTEWGSLGELANSVWDKGLEVEGLDSYEFRQDSCGALMARVCYGDDEHPFGWRECTILPESKGGDKRLDNLRPMQIKNIIAKGDDYPTYKSAVTLDDDSNVECVRDITVNQITQNLLNEIYSK